LREKWSGCGKSIRNFQKRRRESKKRGSEKLHGLALSAAVGSMPNRNAGRGTEEVGWLRATWKIRRKRPNLREIRRGNTREPISSKSQPSVLRYENVRAEHHLPARPLKSPCRISGDGLVVGKAGKRRKNEHLWREGTPREPGLGGRGDRPHMKPSVVPSNNPCRNRQETSEKGDPRKGTFGSTERGGGLYRGSH